MFSLARKVYSRVRGKEACWTSDSEWAMQIPSWSWNSGSSSLHVFCELGKSLEPCGGYCRSMVYWDHCYKHYGPCIAKVRAVFVFFAQSQTCLEWVYESAKFPPCLHSCWGEENVWFGNLRNVFILFADDLVLLVSSELQHTLWFPGLFANECEGPGWESALPILRPWFSAVKWLIALSRFGVSCCPLWRSLSITGSCSRMTGRMEHDMVKLS